MDGRYADRVDGIYGGGLDKEEQSAATSALSKRVAEEMEEAYPGDKTALEDLMCRRMYEKARINGTCINGRRLDKRRSGADAGYARPCSPAARPGPLPRPRSNQQHLRHEKEAVLPAGGGNASLDHALVDDGHGEEGGELHLHRAVLLREQVLRLEIHDDVPPD